MTAWWRPAQDPNVSDVVGFCNACAAKLDASDRLCPCCGTDTAEANLVTVLKRTSARRARRRDGNDGSDDNLFPL